MRRTCSGELQIEQFAEFPDGIILFAELQVKLLGGENTLYLLRTGQTQRQFYIVVAELLHESVANAVLYFLHVLQQHLVVYHHFNLGELRDDRREEQAICYSNLNR